MGIVKFFLQAVETLGFEQTGALINLGKKGIIQRFDSHGINTLPLKRFFDSGDYDGLKMMFAGFEAVEFLRVPLHQMNRTQKIGTFMFLAAGFEDGDISWGGVVPQLIADGLKDEDGDVRLWALKSLLAALSARKVDVVKVLPILKGAHKDTLPYLYAMGLAHDMPRDIRDAKHLVPFIVYGLVSGVKPDMKPLWDMLSADEKVEVLKYVGMAVDSGTARFHDGIAQVVNLAMNGEEEVRRWGIRLLAAGVFHGDVPRDTLVSFIEKHYNDEDPFIRVWTANLVFHGIRTGVLAPDDVRKALISWVSSSDMELFEKVLDTVNLIMTTGKLTVADRPLIEAIKNRASEESGEYWQSVNKAASDVLSVLDREV
ncbi:MAG: hypothetical protein GXO59_03340 [Dictyoglomi bacterium]|nr:hypothetical protein [Dictyoglomota bacterium]